MTLLEQREDGGELMIVWFRIEIIGKLEIWSGINFKLTSTSQTSKSQVW
jgi:hypothetical protein